MFFIFTFLHLYANFRAVSSVVMETVNIPRLHILVTEFLTSGFIMTPQEVGSREPIIFGNVIDLKRTNVEIQSHASFHFNQILLVFEFSEQLILFVSFK